MFFVCLLGGEEESIGLFAFLAGVESKEGKELVLSPLVPVLLLELNNLLTVYGLLSIMTVVSLL